MILLFISTLAGSLTADLSDDMVGYWDFDEGEGNLAIDKSGNGNDGIIDGAVWVEGISGKALSFDGIDDWVDIGTLNEFGGHIANSTVSMWLKTDYTEKRSVPLKIIQPPGNPIDIVYAIECNRRLDSCTQYPISSGHTMFYIRDANGRILSHYIDSNLFDNRWHHVVWRIIDAETNQMEVYVDGAVQSFINVCAQNPSVFNQFMDSLVIGASNNRGTLEDYFRGFIDEVRIYNRALTCAEINALYELKFSMVDFDHNDIVDISDLGIMTSEWLLTENLTVDIAPECGDGTVNMLDFIEFAKSWFSEKNIK